MTATATRPTRDPARAARAALTAALTAQGHDLTPWRPTRPGAAWRQARCWRCRQAIVTLDGEVLASYLAPVCAPPSLSAVAQWRADARAAGLAPERWREVATVAR